MQKKPSHQKKAAFLPASGIGDGLIMTTAAHLFQSEGFSSTLFHPHLLPLQPWFRDLTFSAYDQESLISTLQNYDYIFVQNDNSEKIASLIQARKENLLPSLSIFYSTHKESKHAPLHDLDFTCDLSKPIVVNLALSACRLLHIALPPIEPKFSPPPHLQKSRYSKRIVLHPTSGSLEKNWSKKKFLLLAQKLQQKGFSPVIAVSPEERDNWKETFSLGIDVPLFHTIENFASFLYESKALIGNDSFAGHLSSYFSLPTFILAAKPKHMQFWQPGWRKAELIFPPFWVPNWKGFRLLETKWQMFIGIEKVIKTLLSSLEI